MEDQVLEIRSVENTPFSIAKDEKNQLSLICGMYRFPIENEDVETVAEDLKKYNWYAISLLCEAMVRDLISEKSNE